MSPSTPQLTNESFHVEDCAVVFIDLMEATLATVRTMPADELRDNASHLADLCALFTLPTIFALAPLPQASVPSAIAHALPQLQNVTHSTNDCWNTRAFISAIAATGRKQLIFAGIATDVGVALTALSATRAGYRCAVLSDVTGTVSQRAEQAAFARLTAAGVTLTAWSSLLGELAVDYAQGKGPQALALLHRTL